MFLIKIIHLSINLFRHDLYWLNILSIGCRNGAYFAVYIILQPVGSNNASIASFICTGALSIINTERGNGLLGSYLCIAGKACFQYILKTLLHLHCRLVLSLITISHASSMEPFTSAML